VAHPRRPDPAQGVFETLLVTDGRPVELEAHLARLGASLAELFPKLPPPEIDLAEIPRAEGAMRVDAVPAGDRLEVAISFRKAPDESEKAALRSLAVAGGLGRHKWRDRALLDDTQARVGGLPLIVDADGELLEASRANLFAVRDGALFTPPLDGRILPGVTRGRVLEIAADNGVATRESVLCRDDLLAAEEVFLTGSVRGIEPAASLDGAALPGGGPVAGLLAAELRRAWLGAPVA